MRSERVGLEEFSQRRKGPLTWGLADHWITGAAIPPGENCRCRDSARRGRAAPLSAYESWAWSLVAALLEAMGYHVQWVAPPGPDQGIDIVASTDPLGTTSPRVKVQVKRRADMIAVDGLRAFLAVVGVDDVGICVSAGGFTMDAETEALMQESRQITLLDLERVFDLWAEHYEKIPESARQLLPLRSVRFLAPTN